MSTCTVLSFSSPSLSFLSLSLPSLFTLSLPFYKPQIYSYIYTAMGNLGNLRNFRLRNQSVFEEAEIEQYLKCTFLTKGEMERLYQRFSALNTELIDPKRADVSTRLDFAEVQDMAELKENPFRQRLCEVRHNR